jgi:hypothetical protein
MIYPNRYRRFVDPVSAGIQAAGQVAGAAASATITSLFRNKVYKAQVDQMNLQGRLAQLSTAQQYALVKQLNEAKTENERFAILQDTVSQINVASVESNASIYSSAIQARAKEAQTTAIIIGSAVILLIGSFYFIYKK